MTRVASVPAPNDILCEHCGYTLNGLPDDGRCPECGEPVADSTVNDQRVRPTFEREDVSARAGFVRTSGSVIFRPTEFFRTVTTRSVSSRARTFAGLHWLMTALLASIGIYLHMRWYSEYILALPRSSWIINWIAAIAVFPATYFSLDYVTRLAAKLTAWEAAYRGIRLPYTAVLRALHYHAAHYLPVALIGTLTVAVYTGLLEHHYFSADSGLRYLYVLCGEVVVGAFYLFHTYWIGMRRMMYANR